MEAWMTKILPTSRISILDIGTMDRELIREVCKLHGYRRFACYRITQDSATLLVDTADLTDSPITAKFDCSSYYHTAKSRVILASGWQPLPSKILKAHPELKGLKSYLPVQDLWSSCTLFLVKKDGRRTGKQWELDGFLEALGKRFHYWIAGDELRHFIDETTSNEHTHAFSAMLSQILSHEIRNPVTNLLSLSQTYELLMDDVTSDQAKFASEVGRFAQQIWTIIQKIEVLTFSDGTTKAPEEPTVRVDLRPVIQESIQLEQASHPSSPSKIMLSLHESSLIIFGIRNLVALAIRELIKNAYQYANGTPIRISVYPSGSSLILDFEEDGVPVLPGHEEMIFMRYYQGPKNLAQKGTVRRGLGLGLFVARFVSTIHAGQLLFVRGIGKKGTFRMILPLAEEVIQRKAS